MAAGKPTIDQAISKQVVPVSILHVFSVGLGPSSSHTVGPMRAAAAFAASCKGNNLSVARLEIIFYGSLAYTGKGHGSDKATVLGLEGSQPENITAKHLQARVDAIKSGQPLQFNGQEIKFSWQDDIVYNKQLSDLEHPNPMDFRAFSSTGELLLEQRFYSVGGGFIFPSLKEEPLLQAEAYPFSSAYELFNICRDNNLSVAELMLSNENSWREQAATIAGIDNIAAVMQDCISRGCSGEGILPGELRVKRRAPALYQQLLEKDNSLEELLPLNALPWLNVYAMAVNEENAAGHRVVTAPTNGASGIIPAVLAYYLKFCNGTVFGVRDFLLTAGAIALLYKRNASISGAEVGCQGEVGVASSMAAAALTAVLGGTLQQIENAAEIAMEHHLGLTCDPVAGLVQIPCIERNAMGANKAVNAAWIALHESGKNKVDLDTVIATMLEVGMNMRDIYKETSEGGLAKHVTVAEPYC